MKVYGNVDWGVIRGVGSGVSRGIGDEVESCVDDEVVKIPELEIVVKVVSIKIPKTKSMWRLLTV